VAVTLDGTRIVTGSADRTARVWDASTGAELRRLIGHGGSIWSVGVTPDGSRVVTGSSDSTTRVWDASNGAELLQLKDHRGNVYSVAVTPDGSRIVTGGADNTARVWETGTGAELLQLKGHRAPVRSVAVTPDGARIVTGSFDGTARVWDASTGVELLRSRRSSNVLGVAITTDGTRIVAGLADATARMWALGQFLPPPPPREFNTAANRQAVIEDAKRVVPRCLSIEERKTFLLGPKPPGWCIDMHKSPYDTRHWKAWRAGNAADMVDPTTADAYGDFADKALMEGGSIRTALEAAELSIKFDPKKLWLTINRAHAHMLLGRTAEARAGYLAHRGEKIDTRNDTLWEEEVVDDFKKLRENGRENPLMIEIEQLFKSRPAKADK
jgi:hypothetical protein